jgi:uncharacterized protein
MKLIEDVLSTLENAIISDVRIGLHWTAVLVERDGKISCGLASTVGNECHVEGMPDVKNAGQLRSMSGLEVAQLALSTSSIESSIGIAAINALLVPTPEKWVEINAEQVIAREGEGKSVAMIGSFSFASRIKNQVKKLYVFDLHPKEGEYSPSQMEQILPAVDVIAITGMTLVNKTLDSILTYCKPTSIKLMLGPSTFLSDVMFDHGFQLISGAYVEQIAPAIQTMCEGGTFKQVHRAGVKLVTMARPTN